MYQIFVHLYKAYASPPLYRSLVIQTVMKVRWWEIDVNYMSVQLPMTFLAMHVLP